MSNNKMLIDATHPEETRVVVLRNGRVEEFDFESAARKLLRGNIYLAKVTRVEPSLQAAFVDYGVNRHGFLAFNEIHPDYYQIPVADRQALLDEEAAQEAAEEAAVDAHAERLARRRQGPRNSRNGGRGDRNGHTDRGARGSAPGEAHEFQSEHEHAGDPPREEADHTHHDEAVAGHEPDHEHHDEHAHSAHAGEAHAHHDEHDDEDHRTMAADVGDVVQIVSEPVVPETVGGFDPDASGHGGHDDHDDHPDEHHANHDDERGAEREHARDQLDDEGDESEGDENETVAREPAADEIVDESGSEDMVEELPQRPRRRMRSYKIQEVIKRRQIILVQVVKEERGNKGAALTTYLSLAGRYTVLMPNTARGGGISRKITQPGDRRRLKAIANELEVPEGMGLIIRTAGAARSSQEIKRDFEYLLRLWESVRQLTLESTAPSLVYEEGNLIKRSIRDLYNKDVEEVVVAGEAAHHEAQDFMRMLMPSHAKNVMLHKGGEPLFTRYRMEQQLAAMFSPQVTLKSGGYLVINQTEALVAIDVNSGKSTREYSIEETALNTNLEAADEIARQLKLRDLAGLIVIDFIDMEEKRNNRNVERRLKDALRFDRARIQLGRISHFGLMEMSRQRLRTGVLEGSTTQCPHCQGTGIIRSIESIALAVIRGLEDALMSGTRMALVATTTSQVALYILNSKRAYITDMEARHGLSITVQGSDKLQGANFTIDKVAAAAPAHSALRRTSASAVNMEWGFSPEDEDVGYEDAASEPLASVDEDTETDAVDSVSDSEGARSEEGRRRRRRRGRRNRRDGRPQSDLVHANGDEPRDYNGDEVSGEGRIIEVDSDDDEPEEIGADEHGHDDEAAERRDGEGAAEGQREDGPRDGEQRRRRRRGRRGGRRNGRERDRTELAPRGDGAPYADNDTVSADHGTGDIAGRDAEEHDPASPSNDDVHPGNHHGDATEHHHSEPSSVSEAEPAKVKAKTKAPTRAAPEAEAKADEPAPAPEPVAKMSEPAEPKPRRTTSSSTEPVLERVVVSGTSASSPGEPEAAKPTRRGWWQKKLGIE